MGDAAETLPTSLDWYRQAANWLVGLSTGAVALGLTVIGELKKQSAATKLLAAATGGTLVLTVLIGVFFYLFILNFANIRERRRDDQRKLADSRDVPARQQLERRIAKAKDDEREYLQSINFYYRLMIVVFPLSLLFIVGTITASVVTSGGGEGDHRVIRLPTGTPAAGRTFILDQKSGRLWEISGYDRPGSAVRVVPVPVGAPAAPAGPSADSAARDPVAEAVAPPLRR